MQPYLGRCKSCEFTLFATAEDLREVEDFSGVKAGLAYRVISRNAVYGRCTNRHQVFRMKPIKGTYSKDHKCDSRCLNAKGYKCTCSCGGANHGRGHTVIVHEASETPTETPERLLGEIGKYIKGEAMVHQRTIIEATSSILYTFVTLDRSAKIKWFATMNTEGVYYHSEYEIGAKIKFRARVKKHEQHEKFGNATIITDFEEL